MTYQIHDVNTIKARFGESAEAFEQGLNFQHSDSIFLRVKQRSVNPEEMDCSLEGMDLLISGNHYEAEEGELVELDYENETWHKPVQGQKVEVPFKGTVQVTHLGEDSVRPPFQIKEGEFDYSKTTFLFQREDCPDLYFLGDSLRGAYGTVGLSQEIVDELSKENALYKVLTEEPITLGPKQTLIVPHEGIVRVSLEARLNDPDKEVVVKGSGI
ncbi:hypothetical protein HOE37_04075 [Candidatus Woesearchaeota archaeon]|jgi:hypothetical protein|nr:hypothetical protein [Candidatus Woesearchaeota archaeon]MBT4111009.1 hypothetical protein [Candidatus Woesearchaeota archaeon]MBT4336878.1 hypothetical protein [Candidatus Woesearchaeota archaeon]MBT4469807.1 hypothetical protein [Candidatus Woesearchaeota archaeon]MBT6743722.1 hypothetical protein [Candidatus Woesearchaeota archaeon]